MITETKPHRVIRNMASLAELLCFSLLFDTRHNIKIFPAQALDRAYHTVIILTSYKNVIIEYHCYSNTMHLLSPVGATRQAWACLKARAMLVPKKAACCDSMQRSPKRTRRCHQLTENSSEQQPGPVSQYPSRSPRSFITIFLAPSTGKRSQWRDYISYLAWECFEISTS